MNLEQRERLMAKIKKLEGLLAYAVAHGEFEEADRVRVLDSSLPSRRSARSESRRLGLRQELAQLVEGL